jgi:ABC-type transport system involved in multi-copper enzyme maturation permease subunit
VGRQLWAFVVIAIKNGIRDRVLHAILAVGLLLLVSTPVVAVFSMRQVVALAVSYSLSVIALLGLLLTLFLSMAILSRDMERRSIYTVCSLPLSRSVYLIGRFLGFAVLLLAAVAILGLFASAALYFLAIRFPSTPAFSLGNFLIALWFQYWLLLITGGVTLLFSVFATSSFLPLALSVGIYFAAFSTEAVKFYVESSAGAARMAPVIEWLSKFAYWILPNFAAFDLKIQAIYALELTLKPLLLTQAYGVGYLGFLLVLATTAFRRREFL